MKVKRGTSWVKLPADVGMVASVMFRQKDYSFDFALLAIPLKELARMRLEAGGKLLGRPIYFSPDLERYRLEIHPACDTTGEVKIAYHPSMKEC